MAKPIPRNPNSPQPGRPAARFEFPVRINLNQNLRQAPQNIFIDEAELPPGRIPLWVNRVIRWMFFFVVEGIILSFCFRVLGSAFKGAPEFMTTMLMLFKFALFLLLSYHAIFRINIFR